uniref:Uncharacterized protein n=1 Tax=Oncorhynchus tshawytscha TaxID=74940 RepID=A0AAZ3Q1U6_ONCTS
METPCALGWFLLCLLSVIGIEGQNVTLHMLGRGAIPNSGCNKEIISSDGTKVTWRSSVRYHFFGVLKTGDVSLTILNKYHAVSDVWNFIAGFCYHARLFPGTGIFPAP